MRDVQEHVIDGFTYKVEKLGAKIGKRVLARMIRLVGPAIEAENTLDKLCTAFSDEQLDFFCDTFAAATRFSAEDKPEIEFLLKDKFDEHFAGRYGAMMQWLKASVETNYANFFDELGLTPALLEGLMKSAVGAMSPTAPTMPSGASSVRASES
jgi:hypothetical protein